MARSSKIPANTKPAARGRRVSQVQKLNHLKDEVYREMLLLEIERPGAEMGLALALLRAVVQSGPSSDQGDFTDWLKSICPVGLRMIEVTLGKQCKCGVHEHQRQPRM